MLRTYLSWLISASLNASSCCFCLLFIATEIIDEALIAPAPPGKEGYQKNKNYLKGFRFSSFSTLSSPLLSIHHFSKMVSTKKPSRFKNCHYYYINAILGRLQIELAKIKRVKWHLEYWNGLFGIHNRLEIIFLHIGNRLTFPQIALVINDSSKFSNTLSDLPATISRWTHFPVLIPVVISVFLFLDWLIR